jgi:hypothetical protein
MLKQLLQSELSEQYTYIYLNLYLLPSKQVNLELLSIRRTNRFDFLKHQTEGIIILNILNSSHVHSIVRKARSGELKCYQCHQILRPRDGKWFKWKALEVFLCRICEKNNTYLS